jgi:DnaJ family protein B protein 12
LFAASSLTTADKNKAPEAEEAFKVVSAAFQCLSDPQKRAHYDAYGEDEPNGGQRQQRQQYQREEDLSPEDVFNMFFNGGMNMGGGVPRRAYTYRRQAARPAQGERETGPAALFSQFAHFLPLLLLLFFGLLSSPSGEEQIFGLEKSAAFPVGRSTAHAKVDYYVTNQFQYRFNRDIRALQQVEAMVEAQAFKKAEEECTRQKKAAADEERRVKKEWKGAELAAKLQALHSRPLEACERLNRYQTNAHGAARGG